LIFRRFRMPLLILAGTMLYGVVGYLILIDGATVFDALYWTTLTLGGVGYRDTQQAGIAAELFSVSLIVLLLAAVAVTIAIATDLGASGELGALRRDRTRSTTTTSSAATGGSVTPWPSS
jgi:Ion channel